MTEIHHLGPGMAYTACRKLPLNREITDDPDKATCQECEERRNPMYPDRKEKKNPMISRYDNVHAVISDNKLVITVELDESKVDVQPSGSGKTLVIATTGGAQKVGDGSRSLNLTLYRKP